MFPTQDSLRSYIQEKEEEESGNVIVIDVPEGTVVDSTSLVIMEADEHELVGEENDEDDTGITVEGSHTSETSGEGGPNFPFVSASQSISTV